MRTVGRLRGGQVLDEYCQSAVPNERLQRLPILSFTMLSLRVSYNVRQTVHHQRLDAKASAVDPSPSPLIQVLQNSVQNILVLVFVDFSCIVTWHGGNALGQREHIAIPVQRRPQ